MTAINKRIQGKDNSVTLNNKFLQKKKAKTIPLLETEKSQEVTITNTIWLYESYSICIWRRFLNF